MQKHVRADGRRLTLDIAFVADAGRLALYGPSGAGKSLTLQMIGGLIRPDAGRIVVDGVPWFDAAAGIDRSPRERGIGYLFQDYALFPHWTVTGNVAAAFAACLATAADAAAVAGRRGPARALRPRRRRALLSCAALRRAAATRGPRAGAGIGTARAVARRAVRSARPQVARAAAQRARRLACGEGHSVDRDHPRPRRACAVRGRRRRARCGSRGAGGFATDHRRDRRQRVSRPAGLVGRSGTMPVRPPGRLPSAMDFAFILDPLPLLKAYKDTSISMMRALAAPRPSRVRARAGRPLLARRPHRRAQPAARAARRRSPLVHRGRGRRAPAARLRRRGDAQGSAVRHGIRLLDVPARDGRGAGRARVQPAARDPRPQREDGDRAFSRLHRADARDPRHEARRRVHRRARAT